MGEQIMGSLVEMVLFAFIICLALYIASLRSLFAAAMLFGIFSLLSAGACPISASLARCVAAATTVAMTCFCYPGDRSVSSRPRGLVVRGRLLRARACRDRID